MAVKIQTSADFDWMHDLYENGQVGASAWLERADGTVRSREVRFCKIDCERTLSLACRILQPNGEDDFGNAFRLCQLFEQGNACLYVECIRERRKPVSFGSVLVGGMEDVQKWGIGKFKKLPNPNR